MARIHLVPFPDPAPLRILCPLAVLAFRRDLPRTSGALKLLRFFWKGSLPSSGPADDMFVVPPRLAAATAE